MGMKYHRHSAAVIRSKRWKALRLEALRRDRFRCVGCGAAGRLEVDHVEPVRTKPERSFDLANLQCLCPSCHARKTRLEIGRDPLDPQRQAWRDLVQDLRRNPPEPQETHRCLIA